MHVFLRILVVHFRDYCRAALKVHKRLYLLEFLRQNHFRVLLLDGIRWGDWKGQSATRQNTQPSILVE